MEPLSMPVLRYFFFVGAALLALLFISDLYLPKSPAAVVSADAGERPTIRINSDRKWPEPIVFDTRVPVAAPVPLAIEASIAAPTAVSSAKARVREAFAQLQPSDVKPQPSSEAKRLEPKPQRPRKIAKRRADPPATPRPDPPVMLMAQRPQFGLFGNNTW
jgi:hypothetical protein